MLKEADRRKRPGGRGYRNKPWRLHHDSPPVYTSLLVPQPPQSPDLAPADFCVPEVDIHSERSPIADDGRDRRHFAMGPTRYPAKRDLGRVLELEETMEAAYRP
jgi:hypothetical protein